MSQPTVAAIMLVNGRVAMLQRAIKSFREQSYRYKMLIALDSGKFTGQSIFSDPNPRHWEGYVWAEGRELMDGFSIGRLRNEANLLADTVEADIIIHMDSDDWSHPYRIAEQVALLESSGADAVGYNELLFWREEEKETWFYSNPNPGHIPLCGSLCYWRKTWEKKPFPDTSQGEGNQWAMGLKCRSVSVFPSEQNKGETFDPRMIASIHGGNTSIAYRRELMLANEQQGDVWRRAPYWDLHCQETMGL